MKRVDVDSWQNRRLQLFRGDSKTETEILKGTCTRREHVSRMQPLRLKPLLPPWKVFARSPTAEKWCGMIFMQLPLSRVLPVTHRGTHKRVEGGVVFHVHADSMLRVLVVAHLLSELISELTTKWRNDTKYATSPGCNY